MKNNKFYIDLKKDFTSAKDILPKVGFFVYKKIINNVIWTGIIDHLGKKVLKEYNPVYTDDTASFSQISTDILELEIEKDNLEKFLFGDYKTISDNEQLKKGLSNRWVNKMYSHTKKYIVKGLVKNSVLTFLNSASISVEWGIKPLNDIENKI